MFNWDDLRTFIEVSRARNFSAAGSKLGVTHTTVSRRIQALEAGLSVRLFDKLPGGCTTTEAGEQLLKLAEQVETVCMTAQELVAGQNPTHAGTVRLSVPEGFGTHFLVKHIPAFNARYPAIELEIIAMPQSLCIATREADLAITLTQPVAGRLIVRKLAQYTVRLYATRQYLERFPPVRSSEDLKQHGLIGTINASEEYGYLDEFLQNDRIKLRFKSCNAQLAAVEVGLGMSFLPTYMAAGRNLSVVLPEEAMATRTLWAVMHEDMRNLRRIIAVWEWLKEIVVTDKKSLVML